MLRDEVSKAFEVLKEGGLILYPTDTIWGIGCDATNAEAVDKVFKLKGRSGEKSLIILLDSHSKLQSYIKEVPEIAYDLIEFAENPLTIIYTGAKNLASNAISGDGTIGVRIVKHEFCTQLLQRFRKPLISTSANISGESSPASFFDISPLIKDGVDYIVNWDQHVVTGAKPSTIIKLESGGKFSFIRK
ncbi:L-threonylcarbamoyladenylate synthase [Daejeonella sp.]|uniref:L-threonylcarbamoyladenylate synthase n=1 Tax=Daejeonella sp. TaxID=2805397 RepID=UPI00398346F6